MSTAAPPLAAAVDALDAVLPQTQCTRCGYDDCRTYAEAIAVDSAAIDRCPPGGVEGVVRLARVLAAQDLRTMRPGRSQARGTAEPGHVYDDAEVPVGASGASADAIARTLDPACGIEGPRLLAVIDEAWCIGCALCLKACPVDAIFGASKQMHTVIDAHCTGCELCVPACPVDCIAMVVASADRTGWDAWSDAQAASSRERYRAHCARVDAPSPAARIEAPVLDKRAAVDAALARARSTR